MSALGLAPHPGNRGATRRLRLDLRLIGPTLVAGVLAGIYVIVSPPSLDLAAHLLRAKLFDAEGFGIWNTWWYAGHHTPGYSVLFPALAAALTPQLVGAIAAVGSAALFAPLARRRFGPNAWLGALWFGAATATNLFTGRLTFALGMLPAIACAFALQRGRARAAAGLAALTALASPVAALFVGLMGAAYAIDSYASAGARARRPVLVGSGVAVAALAPVLALAVAFPEGGTEPFTLGTLTPIVVIGVLALVALPRQESTLRVGVILYTLGCIAAYVLPTPVGSNAARLGALLAGPLAALLWWRRRDALLLASVLPLLYLQWQAPVRDVSATAGDPSVSASYYRPLISFLSRQSGPPFRIEIPFTRLHWEAYEVAPRFPLARGWERQLDIEDNNLFYGGPLTPATYHAWLAQLAVRFVAVADAGVDYSARGEMTLIDHGLPYLRLVMQARHWRVYEVTDPTPIVQGVATLRTLGPDSLTLLAHRPGFAYLRVRFTPYWALARGSGCVSPAGDFTRLTLRRAGLVRLVTRFSLWRIGARSARCTGRGS